MAFITYLMLVFDFYIQPLFLFVLVLKLIPEVFTTKEVTIDLISKNKSTWMLIRMPFLMLTLNMF